MILAPMKKVLAALFLAAAGWGCGHGLDMCASKTDCSGGGAYEYCYCPGSTCAYWKTTDGTRFDCASSTDLDSCTQQVIAWCQTH